MSKRKKQKVYLVVQYPKMSEHSEEARVIDVHATKKGALVQQERLADPDGYSTYRIVKKSVQGSEVDDVLYGDSVIQYSFLHTGDK